jgi:signal peptidase II
MLRWLWLSLLVILLDQGTKYLAENQLQLYQSVPVLSFFNFTLAYNTGAAFSFLADAGGWQRWFFMGLAFAVSMGLIFWLRRLRANALWEAFAVALILGGALGNVIDRLWHGYVIDFIDLYYQSWHWPAFNIADSAITVGAALLILQSLLGQPAHKEEGKSKESSN